MIQIEIETIDFSVGDITLALRECKNTAADIQIDAYNRSRHDVHLSSNRLLEIISKVDHLYFQT